MADKKSKPTLDQRRAHHAWKALTGLGRDEGGKRIYKAGVKDVARQARKLPTRILTAGLGQALAFIKAKGNAADLLVALGEWVLHERQNPDSMTNTHKHKANDAELLMAVIERGSDFLRRATDETLAYLLWFNRFAEAEKLAEGED